MFHSAAPYRLLLILLVCGGVGTHSLRAELTAEQKKALFRKSHQSSSSSKSPRKFPASSSTAKSSSKKKGSSSGGSGSSGSGSSKKRSASTGSHAGSHNRNSSAKSSPRSSSHKDESTSSPASASHSHNSPGASATTQGSSQQSAPTPASVAPSTTLPLPHGATPSAPITIEKSGVEPDQGLEPAPPPPAAPEGLWSRLFGSRKSYTYLSSATRAAIDRAHVRKGRWKYIIVHNSGTREGNARVFDIYHLRVRHMQNGLAYHFVIGDGHGSGDGQVETGNRWTRQINGGHVASDYLNDIALGICLVGDYNRDQPTKAQIGALEELVSYLRNRVGKSQGRQAIVHAHKEINPRPTDCPGDHFPYGWLHAKFR